MREYDLYEGNRFPIGSGYKRSFDSGEDRSMTTAHNLFCIASLVSVATLSAFAQTVQAESSFAIVHACTGPDGAYPVANGLELEGGKLYGTTPNGGDADAGVVFQLTAKGKETMHS